MRGRAHEKARGGIILSGIHQQPLRMLRKTGFIEIIGCENFQPTYRRLPDTSFLCSRYRNQVFTSRVIDWMDQHKDPLPVSTFLLLEFRQSTRLQVRLHRNDRTKGYGEPEANAMLRDLQADLALGILEVRPVDWPDVHHIAERLSATHTITDGHRLAGILHVATAIHLGMEGFLTFDDRQRNLAESEGLTVPL